MVKVYQTISIICTYLYCSAITFSPLNFPLLLDSRLMKQIWFIVSVPPLLRVLLGIRGPVVGRRIRVVVSCLADDAACDVQEHIEGKF